MAETKGDITELNDCRSGISHKRDHSPIQEAASFKCCLMKGEEIKVESKMVTWQEYMLSFGVILRNCNFSSCGAAMNEEQLDQECTNPVPLLLTHILQYVQKQ
jgi:hypothetical protein